jgi:hypothetical protein
MKANCWLSPQGKFYYGLSHLDIAEGILARVYKLTMDTAITEEEFNNLRNPERYLEERGWMKYVNRCNIGWWIHPLKTPTQAQINAVFNETGDDISKMVTLY